MSISDRQKQILGILNERAYITVNELSKITYTSPSSIRRDLSYLQNNRLVVRSHGGVTLPEPIRGVASFLDRTKKAITEKRKIAQKAATLLCDGQTIILDSSSTATFLLPYIAKLSGASIFTNNLVTAMNAIELGISTHCFGGHAKNGNFALSGIETYRALSNICADILFFSSQSLDKTGNISDSTEEENFVRLLMLKSAKTSVFLCDSQKFDTTSNFKLCNLENISVAVFDKEFEGLKTTCKFL